MKTTITRVGFCPHCEQARRPHTGQWFLAFGTDHGYKALQAQRIGVYGYTPHIYIANIVGKNVIADRVCAMQHCGTVIKKFGQEYMLVIDKTRLIREIYSLETFKALIFWKNDYQYWI